MKYTYEFVNGAQEVEISEEWATILEEMDREERLNNRRETRRHLRLHHFADCSTFLMCDTYDPYKMIDKWYDEQERQSEENKIMDAMNQLTEDQQKLVIEIFVKGVSKKEYAKREGVSAAAISRRIDRIRKKLEKLL